MAALPDQPGAFLATSTSTCLLAAEEEANPHLVEEQQHDGADEDSHPMVFLESRGSH